jgi:hypothetical protein
VAAALATAPSALAFGTIHGLGQNAEHGRITRLALGCAGGTEPGCLQPRSLSILIGPDGDRGSVSIPDLSKMTFQASAHCDNGDFLRGAGYPRPQSEARAALEACRAWMAEQLEDAVSDARDLLDADGNLASGAASTGCRGHDDDSAKCKVLTHVGLLLHASEDFYAHTNWVDRPDPGQPVGLENPPGLGHEGPAPWIALRGETPFPEGLLSGCFKAVPERLFCSGRVRHADLNKDEGTIEPAFGPGTTPRGATQDNFVRAVRAAIADARDKGALLREQLVARYGATRGATMACVLGRDDPEQDC